MELNEKQLRFCEQYVIDLNGKQAAIRAGYAEKSAEVQASRLLTHAKVRERIVELQKEISQRTGVTADRVINAFAAIAFAEITDYMSIEELEIKKGRAKKLVRVAIANLTKDIPKEKLSAIAEIRQTQHGISIKTHDKVAALTQLGKHLGLFKETHEHTGKDGKPIEVSVRKITHNLVVKKCG